MNTDLGKALYLQTVSADHIMDLLDHDPREKREIANRIRDYLIAKGENKVPARLDLANYLGVNPDA
jgi:hypothetical protein